LTLLAMIFILVAFRVSLTFHCFHDQFQQCGSGMGFQSILMKLVRESLCLRHPW